MKFSFQIALIIISTLLSACGSQRAVQKGPSTLPKTQRVQFEKHYFNASKQKVINNKDKAIEHFLLALEVDPYSHASMYQLGNLHFQKKNLNEAVAWTEKAVETNPNYNHWYSGQLAQLYNRLGMYSQSASVFETMIAAEPEVEDNYIEASNQYLNMAQPFKAIEILNALQEKLGVREEAVRRLDFIYTKLEQPENGEKEIRKLISKSPNNIDYHGLLADHFIANNQIESAIEEIKSIVIMDSTIGYPYFMLYDLYQSENEKELAFDYLLKAFSFSDVPLDKKLQTVSSFFLRLDTEPETINQLESLSNVLLEAHPIGPEAYVFKSDIAIQKKDYKGARNYVLSAIGQDASDFQVWTKLIYINDKLKNPKLQVEDSEKAIELFPNIVGFYVANAYGHIEAKNHSKALSIASEGLEIALEKPDKIDLLMARASAFEGMNDFNSMDDSYSKALKMNPYNPITLNNYAYSLSGFEDQLKRADSLINLALKVDENNPSFLDTKGWISFKKGDTEDAITLLEKALAIDPTSEDTIEHLIEVYTSNNDLEKVEELKLKQTNTEG